MPQPNMPIKIADPTNANIESGFNMVVIYLNVSIQSYFWINSSSARHDLPRFSGVATVSGKPAFSFIDKILYRE